VAGSLDTDFVHAAFDETDTDASAYGSLLRRVAGGDLPRLARQVQDSVDACGCMFSDEEGEARFVVDPIPRLLDGADWDPLAAALSQRVRALEAFAADAYGDQRIVAAGVVPERIVTGAEHYDPRLRGLPVRLWIGIAGLDLIRGPDGRFAVLEDNVRTPSGLAYLLAARTAVGRAVGVPGGRRLRGLDGAFAALRAGLRAAAHTGEGEPHVVLLSEGEASAAAWEHQTLADGLGAPLVTPKELRVSGGRLLAAGRPVDVVYRRTDEDALHAPDGTETALGELLLGPLREGALAVVNAFGTGVADDKLVHAYVEDMIRFYLDEEPELPSVPSYDLSDRDALDDVLGRLDEVVVKPRSGAGGTGVVIGPQAGRAELGQLRDLVAATPETFVAQEVVPLSHHPTVARGRLAPRHVDLRPFVIATGRHHHVVPGGLTRVALDEGDMIVNSSRNGGAKDTWVLD
jgi:uncharacterized circularly permuted ATP-grasp superfamily protein